MASYNFRFTEYARAHGLSPAEMLSVDEQRYPGGRMTGFICWNRERIQEFWKIAESLCPYRWNTKDSDRWAALVFESDGVYDRWLKRTVDASLQRQKPHK